MVERDSRDAGVGSKQIPSSLTIRMRLLSLALLAGLAAATISDCDKASRFRPTELAVNPDPPVANQPVAMTVKFNNPGAEVTDGTVTTSVTLNFIPFQPSEEPLCTNTACPIASGANDRSTSSTWPDGVSGTVVTKSAWTGMDGESLLCVQTKFAVGAAARLRGGIANETLADAVAKALWHDDLSVKQVVPWIPVEVPVVDNATCPAYTNFVWAE
jgi:hypothetical protein